MLSDGELYSLQRLEGRAEVGSPALDTLHDYLMYSYVALLYTLFYDL